jgi:hypothetical protein
MCLSPLQLHEIRNRYLPALNHVHVQCPASSLNVTVNVSAALYDKVRRRQRCYHHTTVVLPSLSNSRHLCLFADGAGFSCTVSTVTCRSCTTNKRDENHKHTPKSQTPPLTLACLPCAAIQHLSRTSVTDDCPHLRQPHSCGGSTTHQHTNTNSEHRKNTETH